MTKYIQDPVNGKFKPEQSEWMTKEQWDDLCERWGQSPRKKSGFIRKILLIVFVVACVFWGF